MATAINTIKGWFTAGKFPTQAQFWAWIDAFRHKDDKVPAADIEGLTELLSPVNEHFNDPNAHSDLFANFAEINTILEDKGFVKTSESFTPNSGTRWNLKGQVFTNEVSIEMPISLCSTGFIRIDRVVLDMNNQFVYVIGDEFTENPVPKALPANTLDYTLIPVNDTEVGDPSSPVIGNIYQQKQFDALQTYIGTGTDVVIPLNTDGRSHIQLKGTMTSIAGLSFSDLVANPTNAEYPHYGKRFLFFNDSGHDIVLKHLVGTEDIFFTFKEETDLVFPNGEFLEFFNSRNVFINVFRSWKDISNKLDKVSTVDVEKVYIKNADGTQGMKPLSELLSEILITNASVSGTYNIDWSAGDVWRLTLVGNTTLTFSNLPASGTTETKNIHINGNYTLVYPTDFTDYITGEYSGVAILNTITAQVIGVSEYKVQIIQPD